MSFKMSDYFGAKVLFWAIVLLHQVKTEDQCSQPAEEGECLGDIPDFGTLYECEFTKLCRDIREPTNYGELFDVDGHMFNCYHGWTPFCTLVVPEDEKDKKAFCSAQLPKSTLVTKDDKHICELRLDSTPCVHEGEDDPE